MPGRFLDPSHLKACRQLEPDWLVLHLGHHVIRFVEDDGRARIEGLRCLDCDRDYLKTSGPSRGRYSSRQDLPWPYNPKGELGEGR